MMMMWPTAATIQNPILLACFDTTTTISFYRHIVFCFAAHTVRNLHFLSKKFNFDFVRKLSILFRLKNSWKCCDFGLFSCWQLWFHEKNCRFFLGVKNSWKCFGFGLFSCWQLWFHEKNYQKKIWVKNSSKCWGFVKIEFLDKNSTFRIVCCLGHKEFLQKP